MLAGVRDPLDYGERGCRDGRGYDSRPRGEPGRGRIDPFPAYALDSQERDAPHEGSPGQLLVQVGPDFSCRPLYSLGKCGQRAPRATGQSHLEG